MSLHQEQMTASHVMPEVRYEQLVQKYEVQPSPVQQGAVLLGAIGIVSTIGIIIWRLLDHRKEREK